MSKHLSTLLALFLAGTALSAQTNKELRPYRTLLKDISPAAIERYGAEAKKALELDRKHNDPKSGFRMSKAEYDRFQDNNKRYLEYLDFHNIGELGCSWYCGGELANIQSTSHLKAAGCIKYSADKAFDENLATAWVEGAEGIGQGESLSLQINSGTIHTISIYNGYQKDINTFRNNARVKRLALDINGKPYAVLALDDQAGVQLFRIDEVSGSHDKPLTLSFRILEVYPGAKYSDTAISDIVFDGPHH